MTLRVKYRYVDMDEAIALAKGLTPRRVTCPLRPDVSRLAPWGNFGRARLSGEFLIPTSAAESNLLNAGWPGSEIRTDLGCFTMWRCVKLPAPLLTSKP